MSEYAYYVAKTGDKVDKSTGHVEFDAVDMLHCDPWEMGTSDALYLDTRQPGLVKWVHSTKPEDWWPELKLCQLPYGDYVFVSKHGVVAIESKTIPDLMGSYERRRLQRQLRHLLTAAPMAILGIVVTASHQMVCPWRSY